MKSFITLIIVVVVGVLAYNYFLSGPQTEEEKEFEIFQNDFNSAWKQMNQAERLLAVSGVDTSAEADDAIAMVEKLKESVGSFIERVKDKEILKKARALEEKINAFLQKNR